MWTCDGGLWHYEMWNCEWVLVVDKCVVNTWCEITCVVSYELYNNPISVYLEKSVDVEC